MKPVVYVLQKIEDFNQKLEELKEEGYMFSKGLTSFEDFNINENLKKDILKYFEFLVIYKDCGEFLYENNPNLKQSSYNLEYDVIFNDNYDNHNGFKGLTLEDLMNTFKDVEIEYI